MIVQVYKDFDSVPESDLDQIIIFDKEKIFEYFKDPFTFNIGIVKVMNNVVGAGIIRVVNEFKMTIDNELPKVTKAKILKSLMEQAGLPLKQCREVIVSLSLPKTVKELNNYSEILKSHYGFERDTNIVMRREF